MPDFHADVFGEAIQLLLVSIDRILHSALLQGAAVRRRNARKVHNLDTVYPMHVIFVPGSFCVISIHFYISICLMSWKRNVLSWGSDRKLLQGTHASRACVTDTAPATFRLSLRRRAGKSSSSTAKAWKISRIFSGSKMVWLWPEKYWQYCSIF